MNVLEYNCNEVCLYSCQIVSRKGKVEDRRPLLLLFSDAPMSAVFNAAASQSTNMLISEHNYRFLKTLTQVGDAIIFITFLNGALYLRDVICTFSSTRSSRDM